MTTPFYIALRNKGDPIILTDLLKTHLRVLKRVRKFVTVYGIFVNEFQEVENVKYEYVVPVEILGIDYKLNKNTVGIYY